MPTILMLVLLLASANDGRVQDQAHALLSKAIAAAGGADKLRDSKAVRTKFESTARLGAARAPCTLEGFFQWPAQFRTEMKCGAPAAGFSLIQVVNGDRAWRHENGKTQEATGHTLAELREGLYFQQLETLLPFVDANSFVLSALAETEIDGRAAVGIRVQSTGHRDIDLYFDQTSFLLVKSAHSLPDLAGKEVYRETVFSDYREIRGVPQFMKMSVYQDRVKVLDAALVDIEFPRSIDPSVFSKP